MEVGKGGSYYNLLRCVRLSVNLLRCSVSVRIWYKPLRLRRRQLQRVPQRAFVLARQPVAAPAVPWEAVAVSMAAVMQRDNS